MFVANVMTVVRVPKPQRRKADEGGVKRKGRGSRGEGRQMRGGGTWKQTLAQQCSTLATTPLPHHSPSHSLPLCRSFTYFLVPLIIFAHYLTT